MVSLTNDFPYNDKTSPKVDALIKDFIGSFICNQYFVWTVLVLFLNYKKWKRTVIVILVLHWLFRSIGDVFLNYQDFIPRKYKSKWPFSNENWFYCFGIASIFWYISEIFGDWYPLLRTTAIIRNRKKIRIVYFICGLYNMIKLVQMYFYLTYTPFRDLPEPQTPKEDEEFNKIYQADLGKFKALTWGNVVVQLVISFFYDLCIIIALRKNLFNKLRDKSSNMKENENRFLTKFKFISEYRIIISLIATIISFPIIVCFALFILGQYRANKDVIADGQADGIRQSVLSINYTLMYVDQILLRFFVEENTQSRKAELKSSNGSSGYGSSGYGSSNNNYKNYGSNNMSVNSGKAMNSPYESSIDTYKCTNLNNTLYKEFSNDVDRTFGKSNINGDLDEIPIVRYSNKELNSLSTIAVSPGSKFLQSPVSNISPITSTISNISPIDKYYPINSCNSYNNFKPNNYNYYNSNKNFYNHNY
ncbi:hypothetical protein PIROE2DRAFT_21438 [Piromyces sp. E2]|nr:hypothetical protein PIROE2DRAFT_21438 [Piromyces sp. E2]|eukprot:OUM57810.1 hypothetical protein PIROE2DRAFT_21438 [Piromyces sp. E2]